MNVVLDGIIFSLQRHGGISVYLRELIMRLRRDEVPSLLTLDGTLQQTAPLAGKALKTIARTARPFERYRLCRVPVANTATVFHSSYYRRPTDRSIASVVTVHDFIYERCVGAARRWVHSAQKFAAIREARALICVSEATLDDLHELVGVLPGQQVYVIHNGVSETFRPLTLPPSVTPFVLFVGQRTGYKNFRLALNALAKMPSIELRCVGGGNFQASELTSVSPEVRQRVRYFNFVSDEMLNELYNQAVCLVYPSKYEGFGIPVLEAMRAGCPVVSIRCKAVLEVGKDALTVADADASDLSRCIELVMTPEYRSERILRGFAVSERFSWEKCYFETTKIYDQVGAGNNGRYSD